MYYIIFGSLGLIIITVVVLLTRKYKPVRQFITDDGISVLCFPKWSEFQITKDGAQKKVTIYATLSLDDQSLIKDTISRINKINDDSLLKELVNNSNYQEVSSNRVSADALYVSEYWSSDGILSVVVDSHNNDLLLGIEIELNDNYNIQKVEFMH
jgi:hypothetical protein